MSDLKPIIEESMIQYAGAVLQNRALIDVRDGLKPSARQIFYSMLLHKLTHDKPYKKTANAVGMAMADFYIHGDSSCEGVIMRAGQPFAMRYPLVDVKGNAGSLIESGNWAAMRYTESRLSKFSNILFADINKGTIEEWRDNYDNTKQYPAVLPSKGYYNICNGTMGIGIGMASSVPQYNLKEMNSKLEFLLLNPDCSFDDLYIAPDFATGAVLLNEDEVKESMRDGSGFACKLRSVVEYDKITRCFVVTEIPYGVYTNTICGQLEEIINSEENPGIDRFNDLTGKTPLIKIYISKKANPDKVLRYLYKNTSLQSHYGINFTMLDKGRFPKVFTWKEMLQAHIDHEKEIYMRGFLFDLKKIEDRLHIIEALLKIIASIDEVIQTIKASKSTSDARDRLMKEYELDDVQAKAVLEIKLSRLAHLEVEKLKKEYTELQQEATRIHNIIENEDLFNKELINGWRSVAEKFGDARRTAVKNISKENDETVEEKAIQISLSNKNNLFISEISSLYSQKRGGIGLKLKLDKGEYIISTVSGSTIDLLLMFSSKGNSYHIPINQLPLEEKTPVESVAKIQDNESFCALATTSKANTKENIIFLTKRGILKKSKLSEYKTQRAGGVKAITLDAGDEIASVLMLNDEKIGMMTTAGQFIIVETKNVAAIGRTAKGRKGMNINPGDELAAAYVIPKDTKELISISKSGYIKKTSIKEFNVTSLNTKGVKIQKLKDDKDKMIDFVPIENESSIVVVSNKAQIRFSLDEIPHLSRGAIGTRSMKIAETDRVVGISLF